MAAHELIAELERRLAPMGSAVVAFSGGVDSSLVAALAARVLGSRALAVTAVSPAVPPEELVGAREVARHVGIAHEVVETHEIDSPDYRRNDRFRCWHCKDELYGTLTALARERGFSVVLSGANADDTGDWRPGLKAAERWAVRHPLAEAGVDKATVRALAQELDVPSAQKPASPCLASRIPYGTPVDVPTLARIGDAERAVRALGFSAFRVRHYGSRATVEVAEEELALLDEPARREAVRAAVHGAGYEDVELSERALRSGSLNDPSWT